MTVSELLQEMSDCLKVARADAETVALLGLFRLNELETLFECLNLCKLEIIQVQVLFQKKLAQMERSGTKEDGDGSSLRGIHF